jgi:riboflavin synthase
MFTGIISDLGRVRSIVRATMTRLEIETHFDTLGIAIGASIACNGACLSVVERGPGWFAVEASAETLSRSTLGSWQAGTLVNLERPLKMGDEFGGHMVLGHIDGVGRVEERRPDGGSIRLVVEAPAPLVRFIAPKGSIAIDGVSMTVNEIAGRCFGVNVIPITQRDTNLGGLAVGDAVNLEIDLLARYVGRLLAAESECKSSR